MGGLMNPTSPEGWTAWDYCNHICHQLQQLVDNTGDDAEGVTRRIRRPFVITLDGAGNGQELIKLLPGLAMNLLTWSFQCVGAATGYMAFYRDVEEGTSLVKVAMNPLGAIGSGDFNAQGHFIPEQSQLLVVVRGGPANGTLAGNVAAEGHQDQPHAMTAEGGEFQ